MDTIDANRWGTPKLGTLEPNGGPKMGKSYGTQWGKVPANHARLSFGWF